MIDGASFRDCRRTAKSAQKAPWEYLGAVLGDEALIAMMIGVLKIYINLVKSAYLMPSQELMIRLPD